MTVIFFFEELVKWKNPGVENILSKAIKIFISFNGCVKSFDSVSFFERKFETILQVT